MNIYPKSEWSFLRFEISTQAKSKYDAIIRNDESGKIKRIPFGSRIPLMEQYKDRALGVYSYMDHLDEKRKQNFQNRFRRNFDPNYYSPTYFSMLYLWT